VPNVALNKIAGEFDDDKLRSLLDELDGKLDIDLTSLIIDEEKKERKKREKAEKTKPGRCHFRGRDSMHRRR
jgi:hypothetical protein